MVNANVQYVNPVIPGFYPDPSVVRVGEDYYLVTSSFEYFPGLPVFHSRDLVNWKQIGYAITRMSQIDLSARPGSQGLYAATIRYHDGLFYIVNTDVYGIGNFYVTAENPAGPWSDPIRLAYGGIDPSLFFDDDGKVYVTVQQGADEHSHIIQYEIDPKTGKALTEPVVVFRGDGGPWVEGPHLYRIDGMYYMMTASGGTSTEHREIIARSASPYGPFEMLDRPILTHRGLPDNPIQYTGHADLVDDGNGNWWAVFLGVRLAQGRYSLLGRETFLAPVRWADGWPMIDDNEGVVQLSMTSDKLPAQQQRALSYREEFRGDALPLRWSWLRAEPPAGSAATGGEAGGLTLLGSAAALHEAAPAVFASVKQTGFCMKAGTALAFAPSQEGEEAGLAARLADGAFLAVGVRFAGGERRITAYGYDQGKRVELAEAVLPAGAGEVELAIGCDGEHYTVSAALEGAAPLIEASWAASRLSPETNWCFTGVCIGLYATGNGSACANPAAFRYFTYDAADEG